MDFWNSEDVYGNDLGSYRVFYERLNDDGEEVPRLAALYRHITGRMSGIELGINGNPSLFVNELKAQAEAERGKEVAAISQTWGIHLDSSYLTSKDFYRQLIEALNIKLSSQKIFQRNKERLVYSGKTGRSKSTGKVDVSKFLGSYFPKVFDENRARLSSRVAARGKGIRIEDAAREVLNEEMPEMLRQALINMYSSDTFNENWEKVGNNQQINEETRGAYQGIIDSLNQFGNARDNPFLDAVWRTYNFDGLINQLVDSFSSKNQQFNKRNWDKNGVIGKITAQQTTAGIFAELQNSLVAQLASDLDGGVFEVKHTGAINEQKADYTVGYEINLDDFFNEQEKQILLAKDETNSVRLQNILATDRATQWMMENTTDYNFIGYVNAKNYDLNQSFNGFRAGSPIKLSHLSGILAQIPTLNYAATDTLIGALMQFGSGAIGTDSQREAILNSLASALAYFLFDDFSTISLSNNPTGMNAIHMFWLSGLYIPLSFFLEVCADAIQEGWEKVDDYFQFTLSSPPIKFGDEELENYTHEMWVEQGEIALESTTLTFTFLSSFQELMAQML